MQEVHLSDRLRLLHRRQASPLWTVVDKQKTQSDPLRSNYDTNECNHISIMLRRGFGLPLAVIDCSPSSSSDPPPAGELDWVSVTRFLGELGPLKALQTLSRREPAPPETARIHDGSHWSYGMMWPLTTKANAELPLWTLFSPEQILTSWWELQFRPNIAGFLKLVASVVVLNFL